MQRIYMYYGQILKANNEQLVQLNNITKNLFKGLTPNIANVKPQIKNF